MLQRIQKKFREYQNKTKQNKKTAGKFMGF